MALVAGHRLPRRRRAGPWATCTALLGLLTIAWLGTGRATPGASERGIRSDSPRSSRSFRRAAHLFVAHAALQGAAGVVIEGGSPSHLYAPTPDGPGPVPAVLAKSATRTRPTHSHHVCGGGYRLHAGARDRDRRRSSNSLVLRARLTGRARARTTRGSVGYAGHGRPELSHACPARSGSPGVYHH